MVKRAGCILINNDKLLLVHHKSSNFWGFPKGTIIEGETVEDAAIRELCEETGIIVEYTAISLDLFIRCSDTKLFIIILEQKPTVNVDRKEIDKHIWIAFHEIYSIESVSKMTKKFLNKLSNKYKNKKLSFLHNFPKHHA
jgi:8-oxo-dGTP pyrophosphatase MutT (NUDIX family)